MGLADVCSDRYSEHSCKSCMGLADVSRDRSEYCMGLAHVSRDYLLLNYFAEAATTII